MSLDASIKAEYAPGGRIYNNLVAAYGTGAAEEAYRVSRFASQRSEITDALNRYRSQYEDPGSDSFLGNLGTQLYNEPLNAPLEQLGTVTKNATKAIAGNWGLWLIIAGVLAYFVFQAGGLTAVKKRFA